MKVLLLCLLLASTLRAQDAAEFIRQGDAFDRQLRTQEALAAYVKADLAQPKQTETLCLISKEYSLSMTDVKSEADKIKRGQTALEFSQRAAAINQNDAHVQLSLAICYARLAPLMDNRTKIAYSKLVKEHADAALKLDPHDDLTLHVLGAWNYELANLSFILRTIATTLYGHLPPASNADATRYLREAIALNPARIGNHYVLGKVYLAEDNKSAARSEWQKALDLPSREKDDEVVKGKVRELMKKL